MPASLASGRAASSLRSDRHQASTSGVTISTPAASPSHQVNQVVQRSGGGRKPAADSAPTPTPLATRQQASAASTKASTA